jgi:hypothetical protein
MHSIRDKDDPRGNNIQPNADALALQDDVPLSNEDKLFGTPTVGQSGLATGYVRVLLMHAVRPMLNNCGNSYANAYTEQWLALAKKAGAYHGKTIGNIIDLLEDWQDWLDNNGGLPEWKE